MTGEQGKAGDLHAQIMNIRCDVDGVVPTHARLSFKLGHKQARHAAAELAVAHAQAESAKLQATRGALLDEFDAFLNAQDALDNHELAGINADDYFVLMRRRNAARNDLDAALALARAGEGKS